MLSTVLEISIVGCCIWQREMDGFFFLKKSPETSDVLVNIKHCLGICILNKLCLFVRYKYCKK